MCSMTAFTSGLARSGRCWRGECPGPRRQRSPSSSRRASRSPISAPTRATTLAAPQAFLPGAGPAQEYLAANSAAIGNAAGWSSMTDVRTIIDENGKPIDLNGDGTPDFVGMGPHGLNYAFGVKDGAGNYQLG